MLAERFFPMVQRLEKLEQASIDADDQFTRGFTAGVQYARRHPGLDLKTTAEEAV